MHYIGKLPGGLLAIGLSVALPVQAQTHEPTVCYMQLANRAIVNLAKLCNSAPPPASLSAAERQAQFLRAFYQQIQNYPEASTIIAKADPDALIGKANVICRALQTGSYVPQALSATADQPEFRRLANLEEAVVAQVAQQNFCPERAN